MFKKFPRRKNPPIRRFGSTGFPDGVNTLAHPSMLKESELSELINGVYSQYGTISKRKGTRVVGQAAQNATKILQLGKYYNIGGESRLLRISTSGKPEWYNFSTNQWVLLSASGPANYTGNNPPFSSGTPTFDTTYPTNIVQIRSRVYFANPVNELVYLDENGWHIYENINNPTAKPTITKTGSATGSARWFYQYVWYNEVGGTLPSPPADPSSDPSGTGWIGNMPQVLDSNTYLTITLPTPPAGVTKVGIFRSKRQGEAFYLDSVPASQTTYVDKGEKAEDVFAPLPEANTTRGYHFYLLDTYKNTLVGTTVELGKETLVWGGTFDKFGSFGEPDGAGYFHYRKGEGTEIRAIKTHVTSNEDSVFVFKDNCFGRFRFIEGGEFAGEGRIQDVNVAIGSISSRSVHVAGNNLRFWSKEGPATVGNEANYGTILRYSVLGTKVEGTINQVTPANTQKICGAYFNHLSLFGISTDVQDSGNNAILVYDERYNAWSLWHGVYPEVFCSFVNPTTKEEKLYYGSSKDANVLEMFTGNTDYATSTGTGDPISLSITTKQYDMGLPDKFKKFDKVVLVFGTLIGDKTTVGITRADHRGIRTDQRYPVLSNDVLSGFGNDEWLNQEFGMMTDDSPEEQVNIRYINMRQKDLFWAKVNVQNDGILDEISLIGVYFYFSMSTRPLPFRTKLRYIT